MSHPYPFFFLMKQITKNSNRFEIILASIAASFIPVGVFFTSHKALSGHISTTWSLWIISLAGLAYSIPSVVTWAQSWTGSKAKAIGFTIMLEGLMVGSGEPWLSIISLILLGGVNAMIAAHKVRDLKSSTFKMKAIKKKVRRPKNIVAIHKAA